MSGVSPESEQTEGSSADSTSDRGDPMPHTPENPYPWDSCTEGTEAQRLRVACSDDYWEMAEPGFKLRFGSCNAIHALWTKVCLSLGSTDTWPRLFHFVPG